MITLGDVVQALRTGEMTDELRDLDITTFMGIISGKPYRRVAVYTTAADKYKFLKEQVKLYKNDPESAPDFVKRYMSLSDKEKAAVGDEVNARMKRMEREYGGRPVHAAATKLVLCNDVVEGEQDFMIEDIIAEICGKD